ncbi:hypothetical protein C8Q78DRAFT_1026087 [Trametes maxima]|nr:hypothetical protein C8Q78DRAFT_1026087 [Trametes maxima]
MCVGQERAGLRRAKRRARGRESATREPASFGQSVCSASHTDNGPFADRLGRCAPRTPAIRRYKASLVSSLSSNSPRVSSVPSPLIPSSASAHPSARPFKHTTTMRFFAVLALTAAVSSASAAHLQRRQYPDCATPCLASADFGNCDPLDDGCLCKNANFISSTTKCIQGACQGNELQTALTAAQQACLSVGVTLTNSAPAATQTAPASGSSAAASSPTSTSAAPAQTSNNAAVSARGVNALAALAAVGAAALAL